MASGHTAANGTPLESDAIFTIALSINSSFPGESESGRHAATFVLEALIASAMILSMMWSDVKHPIMRELPR